MDISNAPSKMFYLSIFIHPHYIPAITTFCAWYKAPCIQHWHSFMASPADVVMGFATMVSSTSNIHHFLAQHSNSPTGKIHSKYSLGSYPRLLICLTCFARNVCWNKSPTSYKQSCFERTVQLVSGSSVCYLSLPQYLVLLNSTVQISSTGGTYFHGKCVDMMLLAYNPRYPTMDASIDVIVTMLELFFVAFVRSTQLWTLVYLQAVLFSAISVVQVREFLP